MAMLLLAFVPKITALAAPASPISSVRIGNGYMEDNCLKVRVIVVGSGTAMGYLNDVRVRMESSTISGNTYTFVFNCGYKAPGTYTFRYVGRSTVRPWNTVIEEKAVRAY
ncbi:hypothetical protein [Butyrivibrio sp. VCB2006]|nr:hypothetical protein [Butyrivibrio sp. VCB2006]